MFMKKSSRYKLANWKMMVLDIVHRKMLKIVKVIALVVAILVWRIDLYLV